MSAVASNGGEAVQVLADLNRIMDRLTETIAEETARARTGQMAAAAALSESKLELARLYAVESRRMKDGLAHTRPDVRDEIRRRHDAFQSLLHTNLTVLATAHAVSEGIIRGVSGELARKRAPSTYGASGRASAPSSKTSPPLALSRSL